MSSIQIITSGTAEKYHTYTEEILPWFMHMMQEYNTQITPLMAQHKELCKQNTNGQFSDEITKLTDTVKAKKYEILSGHISKNIYISPYDTVPTRFHYFDTGCELKFVMKTVKKAVILVQISDFHGSDVWHKFEFHPKNGTWVLDRMFLSYAGENGPYKRFDF